MELLFKTTQHLLHNIFLYIDCVFVGLLLAVMEIFRIICYFNPMFVVQYIADDHINIVLLNCKADPLINLLRISFQFKRHNHVLTVN
jgi:hypothetical protein